jgi:hypothetical protein
VASEEQGQQLIGEAIEAVRQAEEYLSEADARYYHECIRKMQANAAEAVAKNEGIKQGLVLLLEPKYNPSGGQIGFDPQPDGRVKIARQAPASLDPAG